MRKYIFKLQHLILLLLAVLPVVGLSQNIEKPDKEIKEKCYESFYSYKIEAPAYVIYKLYHGGGNVPRKGFRFKSNLPHFTYPHSGYDIGHMCNAEDFASSKELEESTFRYYNAVPQKPNLNRGVWEVNEKDIRKLSQTDSLLIICGGCDYSGLIPARCFKMVYSLSTKKMIYAKIFTNSNDATENDCDALIDKFPFEATYKLYKKN